MVLVLNISGNLVSLNISDKNDIMKFNSDLNYLALLAKKLK